jgi:hypothetical protein
VLAGLSAHNQAIVTGRSFFPQLISQPFRSGLHEAFAFAIIACLMAAAASLMRGGRYQDAGQYDSLVEAVPAAPGSTGDIATDRVAGGEAGDIPRSEPVGVGPSTSPSKEPDAR